ncbi:FecR family protein [Pseudoxanthomonas sacheonensis]|uniref:Transmembrane sensor n=1 Tax=Pseudoxanthomonas sacheonensis TaxID=443615 RepID=A0ABU1RR95_9GAMM|nr:FecR domain-containing protein [Pseudoxanthomonas sacheonensis]MDR6841304.1 transmembrane sensor [Pseudoxanthomonas sacheonensis]
MHTNPQTIDAEVSTAARRWLARLHGHDCTEFERAAFRRWYEAEPAHATTYDELLDIWQRSTAVHSHDDAAFAAALREARQPPWSRRLSNWMPQMAAAAAIVVVVAGLFLYLAPGDSPQVRYATVMGEQSTIALEDGSQLVLDTGTEVEVQYGRRERNLTLMHGQAEFQVQHDPARPFVVHVGHGTVTATGTRFQVRAEQGVSAVTLLEGQVVVAAQPAPSGLSGATATLAPGERVTFESDGRLSPRQSLREADMTRLRAWTGGQLVIRDWPLEKVLAELNRYSAIQLELGDPALRDLPISGRFKTSDPQTFAQSLEYGWPIRAERPTDDRIVLRRR